jgi:hypothetical protein
VQACHGQCLQALSYFKVMKNKDKFWNDLSGGLFARSISVVGIVYAKQLSSLF